MRFEQRRTAWLALPLTLAVGCLTGCDTAAKPRPDFDTIFQSRTYEGPLKPPNQIAVLYVHYGPCAMCTVDGREFGYLLDEYISLLPGEHTLVVKYAEVVSYTRHSMLELDSRQNVTIRFNFAAGQTYHIEPNVERHVAGSDESTWNPAVKPGGYFQAGADFFYGDQDAAGMGDAAAMNDMGDHYMNGWGVERDYSRATGWYRKAAANGNPFGMINLAFTYENGLGVNRDANQAMAWYRKATDAQNVRAKDSSGNTLLHWAVVYGRRDIVELLLGNGADVNNRNRDGWTALYEAAKNNDKDVAELLLANNAVVDAALKGFTPLMEAASCGCTDVAKVLLAHGASVDAKNNVTGEKPLNLAAENGHRDVAALLLAHGANVNGKDDLVGWTPLQQAAEHDYNDVAELLLAHGADVNARTTDGSTALNKATSHGYKDMVALLRQHGARE